MDEFPINPQAFVFTGEFWIAAQREHEDEALEGRAPFIGAEMPDGKQGLAIFTDEDSAERFIQVRGMTAAARPARFGSREQFDAFLQLWLANGVTHAVADPKGTPREENIFSIESLLRGSDK